MFALVSGCIIIHCVIEIIYNLDFKKLFMHKLVLAGCLIGSLAIFAFFRFDISGFDSYMPDASKVSSAGIFSNGIENMYSSEDDIILNETFDNVYIDIKTSDKSVVDRMMLTNISDLQDIAMKGIEDTAANKKYDGDYVYANTSDQNDACMSTVLVGWHLSLSLIHIFNIATLRSSPILNSAGQTRFPIFSTNMTSNLSRSNIGSMFCMLIASI